MLNKTNLQIFILFIILLLFSGFYFFYDLDNLSAEMWDESRNAINALEMRYNHNLIVTHYNGEPDMWNTKPPLFIWTVALFMKLLGDNVLALRLPSALCALFIVIYGFWFSRKYLNNALPGFFAGLVLTTSVGFVDYHVARNGDFDCMLSMWVFIYCTQFFLYLESTNKKHLIIASLGLTFAILTKGVAGCLFLPGLLLFLFTYKDFRTVLKKKELYLITLSGFMLGISYYFIRELFNPGYLKAVMENELLGRYAHTIEAHAQGPLFYLNILNDFQYSAWLYWLLPSFLIVMYTSEGRFKKFGIFLFVSILCNLVVLTLSQTKLKWYDAPLFPFMALLIGMGITQLYTASKKLFHSQNGVVHSTFFILFSIAIFAVPFKGMYGTSVFRKKEQDYKALCFGDFLQAYFAFFPGQHSLKIINHGYNPHLSFYAKKYQHVGRNLTFMRDNMEIKNGDTVMLCDTALWPKFNPDYKFDTIYRESTDKFVITLADSSGVPDSVQIGKRKLLECIRVIRDTPEWLANIKEKSKKEKIVLEQQIMYDALWHLISHKEISMELQAILKKKFNLPK